MYIRARFNIIYISIYIKKEYILKSRCVLLIGNKAISKYYYHKKINVLSKDNDIY